MKLEIRPLQAPLGAEVFGWMPNELLDKDTIYTILRALRQHLVLVFRGHGKPSDGELVRFSSNFGELLRGSIFFAQTDPNYPEILPVSNIETEDGESMGVGASSELEWHQDYSYDPRIGKESFLDAVEVPTRGGNTSFCDVYVALETLPNDLRNRIKQLCLSHSIENYINSTKDAAVDSEGKQKDAARFHLEDIPSAIHSLVVHHPDSGRASLYLSPALSSHIVGIPVNESVDLLKELRDHSLNDQSIYKHKWQVGDMVMFDTIGTMHAREPFSKRRYMRQLTTVEKPLENIFVNSQDHNRQDERLVAQR